MRVHVIQDPGSGVVTTVSLVQNEVVSEEMVVTIDNTSGGTTLAKDNVVIEFSQGDTLGWAIVLPQTGDDTILSYISIEVEPI